MRRSAASATLFSLAAAALCAFAAPSALADPLEPKRSTSVQLAVSVTVPPRPPRMTTKPCFDKTTGLILEMPIADSLDMAFRATTRLLEVMLEGETQPRRYFFIEIQY